MFAFFRFKGHLTQNHPFKIFIWDTLYSQEFLMKKHLSTCIVICFSQNDDDDQYSSITKDCANFPSTALHLCNG